MQIIELANGGVKLKERYDIPVEKKIVNKYPDEDHISVNLTIILPKLLAESTGKIGTLIAQQYKYREDILFKIELYTGSGNFIKFVSGNTDQYFKAMADAKLTRSYFSRKGEIDLLYRWGKLLQDYFEQNENYKPVTTLSTYWLGLCSKINLDGIDLVYVEQQDTNLPTEGIEKF